MDRKKILALSAISSGVQKSENGSSANGRNTDGTKYIKIGLWEQIDSPGKLWAEKGMGFQRSGMRKVR